VIDVSELLQIYTVVPETARIKVLLYAFAGVGKTLFAATAQDHEATRDALFLNLEGGLLTIAGRRDIQATDLQSADHLEQVLDLIAQGHPAMSRFKTLVLDSGSELQTMSLEHNIAYRQRNSQKPDLDEVDRRDYGRTGVQLKRILRKMRDLPINIIVTALPKETKDDLGNITSIGPLFTPSLQEPIMGIFDFVWYMYVDQNENRQILTRDQGVYRAKTRGPKFREALGVNFENPTIPILYNLLMESEGGSWVNTDEVYSGEVGGEEYDDRIEYVQNTDTGRFSTEVQTPFSVAETPYVDSEVEFVAQPRRSNEEGDPNTYDGMPDPDSLPYAEDEAPEAVGEAPAPEEPQYVDTTPEAPPAFRPAVRPALRRPVRAASPTQSAMAAAKLQAQQTAANRG